MLRGAADTAKCHGDKSSRGIGAAGTCSSAAFAGGEVEGRRGLCGPATGQADPTPRSHKVCGPEACGQGTPRSSGTTSALPGSERPRLRPRASLLSPCSWPRGRPVPRERKPRPSAHGAPGGQVEGAGPVRKTRAALPVRARGCKQEGSVEITCRTAGGARSPGQHDTLGGCPRGTHTPQDPPRGFQLLRR